MRRESRNSLEGRLVQPSPMTFRPPAATRAVQAIVLGLAVAAATTACLPPVSRGPAGSGSSATGELTPTGGASIAPTGPTSRPSFVPPTPTPAPTFAVHTVASGDNLNSIAKKYGTSARSIAFWNRSTYPSLDPESSAYRPNLLKLGWTLFLIPNVILTDDEAPPPPTSEPPSG